MASRVVGTVDYSKWDNLDCSDSESSSEDENSRRQQEQYERRQLLQRMREEEQSDEESSYESDSSSDEGHHVVPIVPPPVRVYDVHFIFGMHTYQPIPTQMTSMTILIDYFIPYMLHYVTCYI